jgi:hypothetical protein
MFSLGDFQIKGFEVLCKVIFANGLINLEILDPIINLIEMD